jgi:predicted nucleic acid-binding protein
VLGEFYRVVTRKLEPPMASAAAARQVENLAMAFPVLEVTAATAVTAATIAASGRLAYWDAQICATALLNDVPVVLTEDGATGEYVAGVRYLNPFTG